MGTLTPSVTLSPVQRKLRLVNDPMTGQPYRNETWDKAAPAGGVLRIEQVLTAPSEARGTKRFTHMERGPNGSGYNNAEQSPELMSALGMLSAEHIRSFPDRVQPTELFRPLPGVTMMQRLGDEPRIVEDGTPEDLLRTRLLTYGSLGPKSAVSQHVTKRVHTNIAIPLTSR